MSLERIDEERELALTRGEFVAASAAGVATVVAPRALARPDKKQPSVAVVGAGIAGLTAALQLRDHGIHATVYESSGRLGGRMFSNHRYWADDQVSEWCGELVDSGHATVRRLAARFHLPLDDLRAATPRGADDTYYFAGGYYRRAEVDRDFRPVYRAIERDSNAAGYPTTYAKSTRAGRALDSMSLHRWIESRVPGGHASRMGKLLDVAYATEYGADTSDQSALNLVYLMSDQPVRGRLSVLGVSDERYHIRGGNQRLPEAIAKHLGPGSVVTGMRLVRIARRSGGSHALTFERAGGTRTVVADIVLLALPFTVLRHVDVSRAGFDPRKELAIRTLGAGRSGKLQLQFRRRLWNETGPWPVRSTGGTYADTGYQSTWDVSRAQPGSQGILVDYTGGTAVDRLRTAVAYGTANDAAVRRDAQRFLAQLEPVYPGISRLWTGAATSSKPHLDPNLRLSYSYWRVGQYQRIAGYERVRQGAVYFTGEHTSIDYQGYMEGGPSEGVRAAGQIAAALRRTA